MLHTVQSLNQKATPMKKRSFPGWCGAVAAAVVMALAHPVAAGSAAQTDAFKKELKAVKPAEVPARACKLVARAEPEKREAAVQAVVAATHAVRPVALAAVVGALAREFPALAPVAVAKATALRPKEAGVIARAAASAAPGRALEIAQAAAKAAPGESAAVAAGVEQGAPGTKREDIWAAIATAVPSLGRATANTGNGASVAAMPPPVVGPPFTPLPPTPTEINRTNSIEVPPGGGRDYSGP